jgi:hypothetical protein
MEPRREPELNGPEPTGEQKPRRFRIIKLEERIAPKGGKLTKKYCTGDCAITTDTCWCW